MLAAATQKDAAARYCATPLIYHARLERCTARFRPLADVTYDVSSTSTEQQRVYKLQVPHAAMSKVSCSPSAAQPTAARWIGSGAVCALGQHNLLSLT